jgi:hypothetical protein
MGHDHPFGKAVWYAIVLFAVTHLALSLFYGIFNGDPNFANMFHVLGIDLFWPALGKGGLSALAGVVMIVAAWAIIGWLLWYIDKKSKKPGEREK